MPAKKASTKHYVPQSRVPIAVLIDYIKEGYGITDFISSYPWITRTQVEKALEEIKTREFSSQYAF